MLRRLFIIALASSLAGGCGFKLRGSFTVPDTLDRVSIQGGDAGLRERLGELLARGGATVVSVDARAPTVLITRGDYTREVRDTDADGLATGYDFRYSVDFSVLDADGQVLQPPTSVSEFRTLDFDPGQVLDAEAEEAFLREQMEKDVVLRIMRRLTRV